MGYTLVPRGARCKIPCGEEGILIACQPKTQWLIRDLQVVDDISSCMHLFPIETTQHIDKNHMDMCRFNGLNDPEYMKVENVLRRMVHHLSNSGGTQPELGEKHKGVLRSRLDFSNSVSRQISLKPHNSNTCEWIFKDETFLEWLKDASARDHHGLLWIKGKAGSGKSTLTKYIVSECKEFKSMVTVAFFFHSQGDVLQRSVLGMYRSPGATPGPSSVSLRIAETSWLVRGNEE
jgi:hypothetical protein